MAAEAREFLIEAGADILGSDPASCYAGRLHNYDGYGERISYGQILSQTVIEHEIQPEEMVEVTLKDKQNYKILGSQLMRQISTRKSTVARYGIDSLRPTWYSVKYL